VLQSAGIAAEAGVWSVADAASLASTGTATRWLRILVEITGVPAAGAVAAADDFLRHLGELGVTAPRLLHGEQQTCWPLLAHAGTLGLPSRIGLEDTTVGPDGAPASGNAELTQLAMEIWLHERHRAHGLPAAQFTERSPDHVPACPLMLRAFPGSGRQG
jgi:uncharacterized protein (DUF849 family)